MRTGLFCLNGWPHLAWQGHDVTASATYFVIALLWLGIAALRFWTETRP